MKIKNDITTDDFTRLPSDVNGNPRYYLPAFLTTETAARKMGGRKYRGKQYGAGWVFQTYNLAGEIKELNAGNQ